MITFRRNKESLFGDKIALSLKRAQIIKMDRISFYICKNKFTFDYLKQKVESLELKIQ